MTHFLLFHMKRDPPSCGILKIRLEVQVSVHLISFFNNFSSFYLNLWLVYAFQSQSRFQISAIFEPFLRAYYENFKYKSIDSYQFKEFFLDYFKDKDTSGINWDQWFYTPGMPKYKPKFDESLAKVRTRKQYDSYFCLLKLTSYLTWKKMMKIIDIFRFVVN